MAVCRDDWGVTGSDVTTRLPYFWFGQSVYTEKNCESDSTDPAIAHPNHAFVLT